jgi:hypothetical protein
LLSRRTRTTRRAASLASIVRAASWRPLSPSRRVRPLCALAAVHLLPSQSHSLLNSLHRAPATLPRRHPPTRVVRVRVVSRSTSRVCVLRTQSACPNRSRRPASPGSSKPIGRIAAAPARPTLPLAGRSGKGRPSSGSLACQLCSARPGCAVHRLCTISVVQRFACVGAYGSLSVGLR